MTDTAHETYTFPDDIEALNDTIPEDVRQQEREEARAFIDDEWGYDREAAAIEERDPVKRLSSWSEADVIKLFDEGLDEPAPDVGYRIDGKALLYRNKVSSIAGEPESAKGWFACAIALETVRRHESVVYVDFEDSAKGILARMRSLGLSNGEIAARFHVVNPHERLGDIDDEKNTLGKKRWEHFKTVLRQAVGNDFESDGLGLIVLDGITQALSNEGFDPNKNDEVTQWFADFPRLLATIKGAHPAVLLVDHVTKASGGQGRYAIGAGSKLAALDGVQLKAKVEQSFGRGKTGYIKISVTKDRPGHVRGYAAGTGVEQTVAEMRLESINNGAQVVVTFDAPDLEKVQNEASKLANIKDAILVFLREARSDKNKTDIYAACKGATADKVKALNQLIDDNIVGKVGKGYVIKGTK